MGTTRGGPVRVDADAAPGGGDTSGVSRVVDPARLPLESLQARCGDIHYSVRRYFVDEFFERHASSLEPGSRVIDVGGIKGRKRGQFDIARLDLHVTTVNSSEATAPDVVADAASIPLADGAADAVVLGEVVEHLRDPRAALVEAARLLRPRGVLLATAPFMFRVHPDPIDVGRYAPDWWAGSLGAAGFSDVTIERQGMLFSVLAELVRGWVKHLADTRGFWPGMETPALEFARFLRRSAFEWERALSPRNTAYCGSFATGYGVRAVKA